MVSRWQRNGEAAPPPRATPVAERAPPSPRRALLTATVLAAVAHVRPGHWAVGASAAAAAATRERGATVPAMGSGGSSRGGSSSRGGTRGVGASARSHNCSFQPNTDYKAVDGSSKTGLTLAECCAACQSDASCEVAVYSASYDSPPHACWLKSKASDPIFKQGVVACFPRGGPVPPPPPSPPPPPPPCYNATLVHFDQQPVVSALTGTSSFAQAFNPSWVPASAGTGGKAGLLVRSQNCTPCDCCGCDGTGQQASVLAFAELLNNDNVTSEPPRFRPISSASVVFAPHNASDVKGTEDPRVAYDASTGTYWMLYTCFGKATPPVTMCLASTRDPTSADGWTRHGPLGFGQGSKSGALLIRPKPPHYLYWGAGEIRVTSSHDLTSWTPGVPFITKTAFGNGNVEAGPPPMPLSTGDYVFFHNSWGGSAGYQPAWVVLSGANLTNIIARAPQPLWSPQKEGWMEGAKPFACNVRNVAFLEAAHPTGNTDEFRVYFGGSDAVVGSAVVRFSRVEGVTCEA